MENLEPLPPPESGDDRPSVQRHLISAGALVLAGGVLFAIAGLLRSPSTPQPQIVAQPSQEQVESPATEATPTPTDPEVQATVTDEVIPSASVTDATPTPTPTPTPSPIPTPTTTPTPTPSPTAASTTSSGRIDPASISIQVLDAVRDDGQATANKVANELKDDDYRVVVVNSASRVYEVTTVMYSPGYEPQARQIAKEYGFSEVQPKPDNLTDSVQVHLVVGLDAR